MSKKAAPKNFYVDIPVAPEMVERFKKGCAHYKMTVIRKRGDVEFTVGLDNLIDLYWLGANLFGEIPTNGITKRSF